MICFKNCSKSIWHCKVMGLEMIIRRDYTEDYIDDYSDY